jgi:DNA-binding Xre family transcriptional regulator
MITYAPLFATMKEKKISTYRLINYYNMSRGLIDRLKHDRPITTTTIETLCDILECNVEDVLKYYPDK